MLDTKNCVFISDQTQTSCSCTITHMDILVLLLAEGTSLSRVWDLFICKIQMRLGVAQESWGRPTQEPIQCWAKGVHI